MSVAAFVAAHAAVGAVGAIVVARGTPDPAGSLSYLWTVGLASAVLSGVCFAATNRYLSSRSRVMPALTVGALCGALSSAMIALALVGVSVSLAQFLAVFGPGILAVLLTSLFGNA
jgi:hypothetical protein